MERNRQYNIRALENQVLNRIAAQEFISGLTAEEFDLLWDFTDPDITRNLIYERNGFSQSTFHTVNYSLTRKALVNLK